MKPIVGHTRSEAHFQTLNLFVERLRSMGYLRGARMLDVGCGDGTLTTSSGLRLVGFGRPLKMAAIRCNAI
jgi:hypothetical protein